MRHRIQRLTSRLHHPRGRHRRTPTPPVNTPQDPRRIHITTDGDALPVVRPYVLMVAEVQRAGAVAW
jgi:hypothetical protein